MTALPRAMPRPASAVRESRGHVVQIQGLVKVYRDFWMRQRARAVDNLDLDIREHEIFGLLGPNGSGKSTTIKVILGLLHKTRGRVAVFGKPPNDVAVKRRIGVLPEESYLYPFLNARETLDYYAKLFGLDHRARKRRIDELLEMVGLTAVQHRQIKEYSKGMQRRIGIAQALINDPDFLILDEPTTGLDPIGSRQIKDLIIALGRRGKTILLSSHQLSDVEDCVDRLVILYGGKKRAEGTCDELLAVRSKMTIETPELTEAVIEEIDRLLRTRAGAAIERVSRPRQRLEDLFVDIVEQARAERAETAGAVSGGATASFLLTDDTAPEEGAALIDRLTSEKPALARKAPEPAPASAGPDAAVIESLVEPTKPQAPSGRKPAGDAPGLGAPAEVNRSVIDSLLEGDGSGGPGGKP